MQNMAGCFFPCWLLVVGLFLVSCFLFVVVVGVYFSRHTPKRQKYEKKNSFPWQPSSEADVHEHHIGFLGFRNPVKKKQTHILCYSGASTTIKIMVDPISMIETPR